MAAHGGLWFVGTEVLNMHCYEGADSNCLIMRCNICLH